MNITNPTQLVAEFKKSGEFDRLRRELLAQFKNDESIGSFTARVQDIVQQRLDADAKLQYLGPDAVHTELMQEMDRFPLVERAVADLPALSDPAFSAGIRKAITSLLRLEAGPGQADEFVHAFCTGDESASEKEDAELEVDGDVDMDESDTGSAGSESHEEDEGNIIFNADTARQGEQVGTVGPPPDEMDMAQNERPMRSSVDMDPTESHKFMNGVSSDTVSENGEAQADG
ncbi:hypothetical protein EW145_g7660 [Phellinidium pouzarii]|uniref:BOD1/SHG1 domain-containing protein n=1 Tax=Phellinidium pouzarii TaxID=167371 RepID=A0A4V3XA94_9AGAM|nr:hypothetical protein EW145_g7660 [Phellinidium pouzarii]